MNDCRQTMLDGFATVLSPEALRALDDYVPRRPWREAIPAEFWRRPEVVAAMEESGRRTMHQELRRAIGAAPADAAMEYLPPVPWRLLQRHRVDHLLL